MKKIIMMSALSVIAVSTAAGAADFNTLTTPAAPATAATAPAQPAAAPVVVAPGQTATAPGQYTTTTTTTKTSRKPASLTEARIVPDKTADGNTFKKSDQGYSNIPAYNVVNDQNKPITNDWSRPKNWRIGYKNKNRTPINE
ncbi:MAG: hypothetical protein DI586_04075 [Micavibrio aeruginosavorus]|uniref:Uncharacterized protein n=1 Tax=Micavibrio aeruginosavorus TaxID=349221 RepID=A0A2W5HDY0_9BACT|nr:MAG: hypothetical protein DI586_04075 [Micavibrio aeruginosavorus]